MKLKNASKTGACPCHSCRKVREWVPKGVPELLYLVGVRTYDRLISRMIAELQRG